MEGSSEKEIHRCAYCGKDFSAEEPFSHVIPRQFFLRFKRGTQNKEAYSTYFGRATQREPKEFLLCRSCETTFSKWESDFALNITNKLYDIPLPGQLRIDQRTKLAALSILWRIIHCWVVGLKKWRGTLNEKDLQFVSTIEESWLDILRQQRDYSREEGNAFLIPIDCIKNSDEAILSYKKYPGISATVVFHDQGDGKGFYCVRCLAHKILIFAYLTPAFSLPRSFSIHNNYIDTTPAFMPPAIVGTFIDYAKNASNVKTNVPSSKRSNFRKN